MPSPKFNFVSERLLGEKTSGNGSWKVSILASKASPAIYFPSDMVSILEMDGKYFKFFADLEKKAIGWVEVKGKTNLDEINGSRLARKNKVSGAILFGIGRILKALQYDLKSTISGIEVKTYVSPLVSGEVNYVILPEIEQPYTPKKESQND